MILSLCRGFGEWRIASREWSNSAKNPQDQFIGSIDEVRIYNRTLTESEIKELYEQGISGKSTSLGGGYTEEDLQEKYNEGYKSGIEFGS